ncbi:PLECKSTRIN HOMOLOGY DOMAIN CONTAINING PROTEIN [Salix koriyanagi]|uniref:PLECKSTRIN HOMOLOGY DOMAIN CONTAINING PROTEIN n=1 Tax=Salix koriyanagi TaxID=2511006 RepID=A0A9Q1ABR2_9ROSI|nr:PLECKSTRIN HOMOLOGY DOMAIN CONTAINING PROTEIN [Salix koriyanagi]
MDGEGIHDTVSRGADPFHSINSDGGDATPSQYSSCGESEFERYCSANSVLGTPSVCSSSCGPSFNDFMESDFGSLKSLDGFGLDSNRNFEDKKLLNSVIDRLDGSFEENDTGRLEICGESSNKLDTRIWEIGNGDLGRVDRGKNEDCLSGLDVEVDLGFDGGEDGDSSRYGYSEDDDSICASGSDDEDRKNLYFRGNVLPGEEGKVGGENPLIMSSSVAFGSEDWDDFELQTGGGIGASLSLDKFQQQEQGLANDGNLFSSIPVVSTVAPVIGEAEIGEDVIEERSGIGNSEGDDLGEKLNSGTEVPFDVRNSIVDVGEDMRDISVVSCQVQGAHELAKDGKITSIMPFSFPGYCERQQEDARDISFNCNQAQGGNDTTEPYKSCPVSDFFEVEQDPLVEITPVGLGSNFTDPYMQVLNPSVKSEEVFCTDGKKDLENEAAGSFEVEADPLSDTTNQLHFCAVEYSENASAKSLVTQKQSSTLPMLENNMKKASENAPGSVIPYEDHSAVVKAENFELIEFYDEFVNEMEEILLDSSESPGARFPQGNHIFQSQLLLPPRDGGSTASTSGTNEAYSLITHPKRIDRVEVVGAKQKKGDVSLSERLVGVKGYTMYVIRVWSGEDQWEVERRYRDFHTLYRRLKSLFAEQGWTLPSPWSSVEKESRKIFGNASPDVVSERSVLIKECLHSTILSGFFSSPPSALVWFLCPQDSFPSSPAARTPVARSIFSNKGAGAGNISTLGNTISLIVEIQPHKCTKKMLEAQHYTCAGCHKHFDDGMTLMRDFVQALGWGKPRLCEYTGQLFCSSCHTNKTAVLPARVLHNWDFNEYPVSHLAKSYLDSIHEQPMLCVSAVNPLLFSKVPALHHIMGLRKKIGTMLPYVRCPFHRNVNKALGSRRYLLESNDFFALRDLIDLSRGAFAALPVMVETVSRKILEHITEQCLICCDVGVPCGARQACNDPSSLIYPFQEVEIERCASCKSVFHKPCFRKLTKLLLWDTPCCRSGHGVYQ